MILFSFSTLFTLSINEGDDEDAYYELRQYQIQLFIISFSVSKFISPLLSSLLNVKIITIAILVTNVFISFMLKGNLDNILTVIVSGIVYGNSGGKDRQASEINRAAVGRPCFRLLKNRLLSIIMEENPKETGENHGI